MKGTRLTLEDCRQYILTRLFTPAEEACSRETPGRIGIELESFPYRISESVPQVVLPVPLYEGPDALIPRLMVASEPVGGKPAAPHTDNIHPERIEQIAFPDGDRIFFEPGGQVEISTAPHASLGALEASILSKQSVLHDVTIRHSIRFMQSGTNPWLDVDATPNQLDRPRYQAMQRHFDRIGPYGRQMMRLTCGMHINLDLGEDPDVRARRIVAANLLVPFATALFANSPRIAGKITGHASSRSFIWQHTDPLRTGILASAPIDRLLDPERLVDAYLDFALEAPMIYLRDQPDAALPHDFTFLDWLNRPIHDNWPSIDDFRHQLSLLFPEVRWRGYLELRSVDAPPPEWQMIPPLFYTALLYTNGSLDKILDLLAPFTSRITALWKNATNGLASDELYPMADSVMRMALDGLAALPPGYISSSHQSLMHRFHESFTIRRRTFADRAVEPS